MLVVLMKWLKEKYALQSAKNSMYPQKIPLKELFFLPRFSFPTARRSLPSFPTIPEKGKVGGPDHLESHMHYLVVLLLLLFTCQGADFPELMLCMCAFMCMLKFVCASAPYIYENAKVSSEFLLMFLFTGLIWFLSFSHMHIHHTNVDVSNEAGAPHVARFISLLRISYRHMYVG